MCSAFLVLVRTRAAAFCSCLIDFVQTLIKMHSLIRWGIYYVCMMWLMSHPSQWWCTSRSISSQGRRSPPVKWRGTDPQWRARSSWRGRSNGRISSPLDTPALRTEKATKYEKKLKWKEKKTPCTNHLLPVNTRTESTVGMCAGVFVLLTVCMKQCSLSSLAYSTPSLMKTEIALKMNDTNRFMWMKFLVQCSFLCSDNRHEHTEYHRIVY